MKNEDSLQAYVLSKNPPWAMTLAVSLMSTTSLKTISMTALLDSGATGTFINHELVQKHSLETSPLPNPIPVHNVDGTPNEHGSITEEVEAILCYGDHLEKVCLAVANIGCQALIIGYPWLALHNPEIDWAKQRINLSWSPSECNTRKCPADMSKELPDNFELESGDKVYAISFRSESSEEALAEILAMDYVPEESQSDPSSLPSKLIPEEYHKYEDVFSKDGFNILPPQKPWDHAIDLIPGAELPCAQMFPISQAKQQELDEFLCENLVSRRI